MDLPIVACAVHGCNIEPVDGWNLCEIHIRIAAYAIDGGTGQSSVDTGSVTDSSQRVVTPPPCPACEAAARERDALNALCDRQADILSRVAVALRGPEPPLTRWSHADLPERAAKAVRERDEWEAKYHTVHQHNTMLQEHDYELSVKAEELADLRARLAAAHNELRQITLALNDERIHNTITLSEAIAELRRQIDESEEVNRTLQARIQRLVDGGAEDRETLVNRLRSLSRQNEQLTLEAAEARGASKRMERDLADLRARVAAECDAISRKAMDEDDDYYIIAQRFRALIAEKEAK